MALKVGDKAPDFSLFDTDRKERTLKDYSGKPLVLAFYPGAFTSVCQKELCQFRNSMTEFNKVNAQVLGISVDSPFANAAFAQQNELNFPLLCDFTRAASKAYCGVHDDFAGLKGYSASKRAVYVLDSSKVVRYVWVTDNPGNEPPYQEISTALAACK
ncbi:MAG: peroxiredoxin [Oligoflexia bacterium]|nr:peroxiredoxin [Oligoflexia bacterium]